jgi:exonuclease SbcD
MNAFDGRPIINGRSMNSSFLHVADVHLDSPLSHLHRLDADTAGRLQRASRRSLELVINAALEHRVAVVVVAGDLFDAPVKDASAGLWAESQFKRLTREGIKVVLIRGNHDALSNACRIMRWSEDIHELDSARPETLFFEYAGIAIHGQSFGARTETNDLAANYPTAASGYFNVGVLHTSLSGNAQHDTYAPTSIPLLESKGYDYWALGHIHVRSESSLSDKCYIGYSGNTQGRHIREPGAKGCQLVSLVDRRLHSVEFIPTDSLRWQEVCLNIERAELLSEIEDLLHQNVSQAMEAVDGRPLAVRVRLTGSTALHSELTRSGTVARLGDTFSARLADLGDVWLESLKIDTRPAQVVSADDMLLPLKYLCQVAEEARENANTRGEMLEILEELLKKARSELSEYHWPLTEPEQQTEELVARLRQAEDLLVARLITEGNA